MNALQGAVELCILTLLTGINKHEMMKQQEVYGPLEL